MKNWKEFEIFAVSIQLTQGLLILLIRMNSIIE